MSSAFSSTDQNGGGKDGLTQVPGGPQGCGSDPAGAEVTPSNRISGNLSSYMGSLFCCQCGFSVQHYWDWGSGGIRCTGGCSAAALACTHQVPWPPIPPALRARMWPDVGTCPWDAQTSLLVESPWHTALQGTRNARTHELTRLYCRGSFLFQVLLSLMRPWAGRGTPPPEASAFCAMGGWHAVISAGLTAWSRDAVPAGVKLGTALLQLLLPGPPLFAIQ